MIFDIIMGIFSGILYTIGLVLPTVDYGSTGILNEAVAGARSWVVFFPPFLTLFRVVTVLIGVQVTIYMISQIYNIFNWIRGSGSLKLDN